MKMVAAAKLRRAQENILANRPYAAKMLEVLRSLAARTSPDAHPLLYRRDPRRIELVVLTSDRGLCGAFNMNLIQRAERFLAEEKAGAESLAFSFIGRKGRDYFRKRKVTIRQEYVNLYGKVDYALASRIGQELVQSYVEERVDAIYLLYSEFKSAIQQRVVLEKILPLAADLLKEAGKGKETPPAGPGVAAPPASQPASAPPPKPGDAPSRKLKRDYYPRVTL